MTESLSRPDDGRVMCCICFELFEVRDLSVNAEGDPVDVCLACQITEQWRELVDD